MQSITLRQLRDTRQVKAWLKAGVQIEVRERKEVLGDLVPRTPPKLSPVEWPDFEARGVYYDVSRGRVPKIERLEEMVEELAKLAV